MAINLLPVHPIPLLLCMEQLSSMEVLVQLVMPNILPKGLAWGLMYHTQAKVSVSAVMMEPRKHSRTAGGAA